MNQCSPQIPEVVVDGMRRVMSPSTRMGNDKRSLRVIGQMDDHFEFAVVVHVVFARYELDCQVSDRPWYGTRRRGNQERRSRKCERSPSAVGKTQRYGST